MEEKKTNTNRRKLLMWLIPILLVASVSAVAVYFGTITQQIDVSRAVTVTGNGCTDNVCTDGQSIIGGETALSPNYLVTSLTSVNAPLNIVTLVNGNQSTDVANEFNLNAPAVPQGSEARIFIDMSGKKLSDISTLEFMQYVTAGYIGHADIKLDINGDGNYTSGTDDALVIEFDKITTPSDQALGDMAFARNTWVNTFDNKGTINGSSKMWLTSRDAGPVGGANFIVATLDQWKAGPVGADYRGINSNTKLIGIEIEVDSWIAESTEKVKDIKLNGIAVQPTLQPSGVLNFNTAFSSWIEGIYTLVTNIELGA